MAVPMTSIISTYLLLNADLTRESRSKAQLKVEVAKLENQHTQLQSELNQLRGEVDEQLSHIQPVLSKIVHKAQGTEDLTKWAELLKHLTGLSSAKRIEEELDAAYAGLDAKAQERRCYRYVSPEGGYYDHYEYFRHYSVEITPSFTPTVHNYKRTPTGRATVQKVSVENVDFFNDLIPILYDPDLLAHPPENADGTEEIEAWFLNNLQFLFEDQRSLNTCLQDLYAVMVDVAKVNKISADLDPDDFTFPEGFSKKAETLRDRYNTHLNATRESIIDKARLLADDTISDKLRAVSTDDMISAESVIGDIIEVTGKFLPAENNQRGSYPLKLDISLLPHRSLPDDPLPHEDKDIRGREGPYFLPYMSNLESHLSNFTDFGPIGNLWLSGWSVFINLRDPSANYSSCSPWIRERLYVSRDQSTERVKIPRWRTEHFIGSADGSRTYSSEDSAHTPYPHKLRKIEDRLGHLYRRGEQSLQPLKQVLLKPRKEQIDQLCQDLGVTDAEKEELQDRIAAMYMVNLKSWNRVKAAADAWDLEGTLPPLWLLISQFGYKSPKQVTDDQLTQYLTPLTKAKEREWEN
jgi:hypothetical protein